MGYVHYLDCGDNFIDAYVYQNLSNCTLYKCAVSYMPVTSQ